MTAFERMSCGSTHLNCVFGRVMGPWFSAICSPPRALNVGNLLPGSAAIAELPLVDGLQPLETLSVAVNDASNRMSQNWRLP